MAMTGSPRFLTSRSDCGCRDPTSLRKIEQRLQYGWQRRARGGRFDERVPLESTSCFARRALQFLDGLTCRHVVLSNGGGGRHDEDPIRR